MAVERLANRGGADLSVATDRIGTLIERIGRSRSGILDSPGAWHEVGRRLARSRGQQEMAGSRQMWAVGDWLVAGENVVFPHLKKSSVRGMAAEISTYSRHTLSMAASVARKFEPSMRIDELTWWHHLVVAGQAPADREMWLRRAVDQGWSPRQLRERITAGGPDLAPVPSRRSRSTIARFLQLRREEIDQDLVAQLRDWWQREMGDDD